MAGLGWQQSSCGPLSGLNRSEQHSEEAFGVKAATHVLGGNHLTTDSALPQLLGGRLPVVDSASSTDGRNFWGGSSLGESSERTGAMDLATLGRLPFDLDGDNDDTVRRQQQQQQQQRSGRPGGAPPALRRGAGSSTASLEEDVFSALGSMELGSAAADAVLGPDPAGSVAAAEQLLSGSGGGAAPPPDLVPADAPSRTLLIRSVPPGTEETQLRALLSSHGDVRSLYMGANARGLVAVSYYDLRAAVRAAQSLSGAPRLGGSLDVSYAAPRRGEMSQVNQGVVVVYNLDPDTTNEQLVWIFSRFGEVKGIQQAPARSNQKFIEFYDVRHAAAALHAMNRAELSRLPAGGAEDGSGSRAARLLSGDGSSGTAQASAAAQVAAVMQQLELEQQQQQQQPGTGLGTQPRGLPIPRPREAGAAGSQLPLALQQQQQQQQHADSLVQAAHRGMVRPVSGMLDRLQQAGVSPPLSLGPLSQSWDTSGAPGSLGGLLRQQQHLPSQAPTGMQQSQHGGGGSSMLQQLQQGYGGGFPRGSRTDLPSLDPVLEDSGAPAGGGDALQKLLMLGGAGLAGGTHGAGLLGGPHGAGSSSRAAGAMLGGGAGGMHVSDSASSIASTQGAAVPRSGSNSNGVPGQSQQLAPGPGFGSAAAAAAAAASGGMQRSFGSSEQLAGVEHLLLQQLEQQQQQQQPPTSSQQQSAASAGAGDTAASTAAGLAASLSCGNLAAVAAAAAAAGAGMGSGIGSTSFDSGLNALAAESAAAAAAGAGGGLGGLLGSQPYLLGSAGDAASGGGSGVSNTGLYRSSAGPGGPGGMRSLSHPCLSVAAMAAAQQQQQQQQQHAQQQVAAAVAAGRLLHNQQAAAAMLQAQAAAAGYAGLQDVQAQQQALALQQLLQAGLQAQQTLAGAANLHAAQQLLAAGLHPQQLAAAGLLGPAALAGLGLHGSSSCGSLSGLGALQLQSAAAAAASVAAAAAAAGGGAGLARGASSSSLSGLIGVDGGRDGAGSGRGGGPASGSGDGRGGSSRGGGRLSRRAADPAVEAERKAQQERLFALDVDRIVSGEDKRTTLMIKNIPNKYTQKMLLQTIEEQFKGTFDFFYLPIDFKNKCNVGYAFINMLTPGHIPPLVARFNSKRWERFNSEKVCAISYGRIQGRAALISHFQNSSLMHEDKRCRPVLFVSDGPEAGEPEAFPIGAHARPRAAGGSGSGSGNTNSGGAGGGGGGGERSPRGSSSGGSISRPGSATQLAAAAAGGEAPASSTGVCETVTAAPAAEGGSCPEQQQQQQQPSALAAAAAVTAVSRPPGLDVI